MDLILGTMTGPSMTPLGGKTLFSRSKITKETMQEFGFIALEIKILYLMLTGIVLD